MCRSQREQNALPLFVSSTRGARKDKGEVMSWDEDEGARDGDFLGYVPDDEPGPELQMPTAGTWIAIVVILAAIFGGAICFGADVKEFGAVGDGVADDWAAVQAAADDCKSKLRAIQPTGGSYMGSCPELFFPPGKYLIRGEIKLCGYQTVRGEDAILIQDVPGQRIFVFDGCYRNKVEGVQFLKGSRQIAFSNANVDTTRLIVRDCTFQDWTEYAITAEGSTGDQHLSATLLIESSNFDGGSMLLTRSDATTIRSSRHQFRGPDVVNGTPSIVNKWALGVLKLDDFSGTPACPEADQIRARWVDNWGSVIADGCRFGGEGGGIPVVYDHGPPNVVNPWMGRKIVISNSQVSCGRNLWPESALITLEGVPQCVRVTGCAGVVSNTIPLIKVADGYDLAAAVNGITTNAKTSLGMYSIMIQGNQFFAPTPIPVPLQQFVK